MNEVQAFVFALHVDDTERVACPSCSPQRRKHNLKEMVITRKDDAWVYHCHHCGEGGNVPFQKRTHYVERKLSAVPKPNITQSSLEDAHYEFLLKRGISRETTDKMKLFAAEKWFQRLGRNAPAIGFPYYRNGSSLLQSIEALKTKTSRRTLVVRMTFSVSIR